MPTAFEDSIINLIDYFVAGDTDWGAAINRAIAAADTQKKPLFIPPGLRLRSGEALIQNKTGLTIFGLPGTVTLQRTNGDNTTIFRFINCTDCHVEGIGFDGKRRVDGTGGATSYAVAMESCTDCDVKDCTFYDSWGLGFFQGCRDCKAVGNTFRNTYSGVTVGGAYPRADGNANTPFVQGILIHDNLFRQTGIEAVDVNWNVNGCTISDNRFIDCFTTADATTDVVDIGGGNCYDINVTNNLFDNGRGSALPVNAGTAIRLKLAVSGFVVSGNTIRNFLRDKGAGIEISDACIDGVISGNRVSAVCRGIIAFHSSGIESRLAITGNAFTNCSKDAVALQYVNCSTVTGNTVSSPNETPAEQGIDVSNSYGNVVSANSVARTVGHGIWVRDCTSTVVSSNSVRDVTSGSGINVTRSLHTNVEGNVASITSGNGIVTAQSPCTSLVGNRLHGTGDGLKVDGIYTVVEGNAVHDLSVANTWGIVINPGSNLSAITGNITSELRDGANRRMYGGLNIAGPVTLPVVRENVVYNFPGAATNGIPGNMVAGVGTLADNAGA